MKRHVVVWLVSVLVAGCAPAVMTQRMGPRYPAKDPDCKLAWDYWDPNDPLKFQSRYEVVAMLGTGSMFKQPDEWTDEIKDALRPEACRVGADLVVMMMQSRTNLPMTGSGGAYQALRRRGSAAPPARARAED